MKPPYTDRSTKGFSSRDEAVANEFHRDQERMCQAHGCPHHWSSDFGNGRLCSTHARAEPKDWPRITQELQDELRRPRQAPPAPPKLSATERKAVIERLHGLHSLSSGDALAGARSLKAREERGDPTLTPFQRDYWRKALARDFIRDIHVANKEG
jgi:hypothetical protein